MAVSGQLRTPLLDIRNQYGLYREDLAVSGQRRSQTELRRLYFGIIPRGFGGIRTTENHEFVLVRKIIPRGFGGIRTTCCPLGPSGGGIIPRGFGGIRTTYAFALILRCDITIIPRGFGGIRTTGAPSRGPFGSRRDYTERIWRYQDNKFVQYMERM